MASADKLSKKQNRDQKAAQAQEDKKIVFSNKALADVVNTVFTAWDDYNKSDQKNSRFIEGVRKLLVFDSGKVAYLIGTADKEIKSFYALHAMLLMLSDKNPSFILAQMSDENIVEFKRALSIAKKRVCPNAAFAKKGLDNRKSRPASFINDTMQKSMQMEIVVAECWDRSVSELDKWSRVADGFRRTKSMDVAAKYVDEEVWTMDEAAVRFGLKDKVVLSNVKNIIVKKHPELEDKIENEMFFFFAGEKFFRAKYFDEIQALRKSGGRKSAKKAEQTKSVEKAEEPKAKPLIKISREDLKQTTNADKKPRGRKRKYVKYVTSAEEQDGIEAALQELAMEEQPKNLVELKAFEAKLKALNLDLSARKEHLSKTEKDHEDLMQQISKAAPAQRGALYDKAKVLDQDIVSDQDKIVSIQNEIDEGNKLLKAKSDLDAQIAAFLARGK